MDLRGLIQTQNRIVFDGAMGTQLAERGCSPGGQSNLTSPEEVLAIHCEYAAAGVDGFLIETMFDLREALCAARACKGLGLPVMVSMAFATDRNSGRTVMGDSAAECATRIADAGAEAIGANCGDLDPAQMAAVVSLLQSASTLPILAQANAGKPRLVGDVTTYAMSPDEFAAGMDQCQSAGARLIGGCCGTTPDHIAAVSDITGAR